jgi:hypothetical protein
MLNKKLRQNENKSTLYDNTKKKHDACVLKLNKLTYSKNHFKIWRKVCQYIQKINQV